MKELDEILAPVYFAGGENERDQLRTALIALIACVEHHDADRHARAIARAEKAFLREAESVMEGDFGGWTFDGPIREAYKRLIKARAAAKKKGKP